MKIKFWNKKYNMYMDRGIKGELIFVLLGDGSVKYIQPNSSVVHNVSKYKMKDGTYVRVDCREDMVAHIILDNKK